MSSCPARCLPVVEAGCPASRCWPACFLLSPLSLAWSCRRLATPSHAASLGVSCVSCVSGIRGSVRSGLTPETSCYRNHFSKPSHSTGRWDFNMNLGEQNPASCALRSSTVIIHSLRNQSTEGLSRLCRVTQLSAGVCRGKPGSLDLQPPPCLGCCLLAMLPWPGEPWVSPGGALVCSSAREGRKLGSRGLNCLSPGPWSPPNCSCLFNGSCQTCGGTGGAEATVR